ncbi:MAG TPA: phosphoglucomutase/phosphomannomutase family protein, partial [Anaerolineae bacterium]|nr:phosphoglucomutase/phosphomannomutase family protein [Anaerolineae bacterium]
RKVSQAIAEVVMEDVTGHSPPLMVIGFDTRFLSDRYAMEVARVLAANDIRVLLSNADAPTPAISYAIAQHQANGGVMVTASHNPPRYNGIKLKAPHGGSASPEQCRRVEAHIRANDAAGREPARMSYREALKTGRIKRFDPFPAYRDHVYILINAERIGAARLRVAVDAMHGAGRGYLAGLLKEANAEVLELHGEMNPGFNGIHPEPIARYLTSLIETMQTGEWDLGLATDGDADRIGAVCRNGRFVDPHRIMALLTHYLVEQRGLRGAIVKSVSTTQMLNRLAQRYGLPLFETPVGFNHISDLMVNDDVLIGGEESGGISIKGHIPEGDGILTGLLLAEMVAASGKSLMQQIAELMAAPDIGAFYYARKDHRLDPEHLYDKKALIATLTDSPPRALVGQPIVDVNSRDGVKYILADDSWLLIRPSGTEPVLRIYAEARTPEQVTALLEAGQRLVYP